MVDAKVVAAVVAAVIAGIFAIACALWFSNSVDFIVEIQPDHGEYGNSNGDLTTAQYIPTLPTQDIPILTSKVTVSTKRYKPYEHTVSLQAKNVPDGVNVDFTTIQGKPTYTSDMNITISNCAPGKYPIEIEATGGDLKTRIVNYTLLVHRSGPILAVADARISMGQGDNGSIELIYAGNSSSYAGNIGNGVALAVPENGVKAIMLVQNATSLYEKGQYSEALECVNNALKLYPHTRAWYLKGVILFSLNDLTDSIKCLNKATDLYPESYDAWYLKGWALFKLKNYEESANAIDKALDIHKTVDAWNLKGMILAETKEYDSAIECFSKALNLNPSRTVTAGIYANMGKVKRLAGRFDEASRYYNNSIEVDPNYASVWDDRGTNFLKMHNYNESIHSFDQALAIDPNYFEAWVNKGNALGYQGKEDEAIQAYDKALEINPHYASAWYNKGVTLERLGRIAEADTAFAKAKELGYNG